MSTKTLIGSNMIMITSDWNDLRSFRMVPVTNDCPYLEAIFDPRGKILALIGRASKTTMQMVPKLDDNGDPVFAKAKRQNGVSYREERKSIDTYMEYYITDVNDIESFINLFALNADTFDYKQYFQSSAPESNIITAPSLILP